MAITRIGSVDIQFTPDWDSVKANQLVQSLQTVIQQVNRNTVAISTLAAAGGGSTVAVHELADSHGLGVDHTVVGLAAGEVLVATGPTTAHFALLNIAQLGGVDPGSIEGATQGEVLTFHNGYWSALPSNPLNLTDPGNNALVMFVEATHSYAWCLPDGSLTLVAGALAVNDAAINHALLAGLQFTVASGGTVVANDHPQYALLAAANSWTSLQTFQAGLVSNSDITLVGNLEQSGANPEWRVQNTPDTVDEGTWRVHAEPGQLMFATVADDGSDGEEWLTVTRSAELADQVNFQSNSLTWNGAQLLTDAYVPPNVANPTFTSPITVPTAITLSGIEPAFTINDTDPQAADEAQWTVVATAGELRFATLDDSGSWGEDWLSVSRIAERAGAINLSADLVTANGATVWSDQTVAPGANVYFGTDSSGRQTINAAVPGTGGAVPVGANPTALVGLAAVNGIAGTFLRSDGAPALDVSISPTWTGSHTFAQPVTITGVETYLLLTDNQPQAADEASWALQTEPGILNFAAINDDGSAGEVWLQATRSGSVVDQVNLSANLATWNGSTLWTDQTVVPGANVYFTVDAFGRQVINAAVSSGGTGTPASPTTSIQFNNAGAFGGSANLTWDGNTAQVTGGGSGVAFTVNNVGTQDTMALNATSGRFTSVLFKNAGTLEAQVFWDNTNTILSMGSLANTLTFDAAGLQSTMATTVAGQYRFSVVGLATNTDGNIGEVQISGGGTALAFFTTGTANTSALVTGGPTGGQAVIRVLGSGIPLLFATNNTYRGQIDGVGQWVIAKPTSGTAITVNGVGTGDTLTISLPSAATGNFWKATNVVGTMSADCVASGAGEIGMSSNTALSLFTNNLDRVVVAAAGGVLINTPTSGVSLTVDQAANVVGFTITDGTVISSYSTSTGASGFFGTTTTHAFSLITNNSTRFTLASNGAATLNAPSATVIAFTATGVANAQTASFIGNSTSGQSFGVLVSAGTTSADTCLNLRNATGTVQFALFKGDGTIAAPVSPLAPSITQVETGVAAVLTAALTSTSATGFVNATGLTITFNELGWYSLEVYASMFEAVGTSGFKMDLNGGTVVVANMTLANWSFNNTSASAAAFTTLATAFTVATINTTAASPSWCFLRGNIQVTTAGTIIVRWNQNSTTSLNATTFMAGSYIKATKIR